MKTRPVFDIISYELGGGGMLDGRKRGRGACAAQTWQETSQSTAGEPRRMQAAVAPIANPCLRLGVD